MSEALVPSPLADLHAAVGARMVPFAGWSMPLQYAGAGIIAEHEHTRRAASLFDVSHMCQSRISGTGSHAALDRLLPIASAKLAADRNKYTFACNDQGGIIDDLIIGNDAADSFFVISNAARAADVQTHFANQLGTDSQLEVLRDQALLALQGPAAAQIIAELFPTTAELFFMDSLQVDFAGHQCRICRCGYTGEDGFEISVPTAAAPQLAKTLLANSACSAAGLGARDSLRLEACLCLYGNDLSESISPIEAGLQWAIAPSVRKQGNFIGAARICAQVADGCERQLVALTIDGKSPVRQGTELQVNQVAVGVVTSGAFSPTLGHPIALAMLAQEHTKHGTTVTAIIRGREINCTVSAMPFVPHQYRIRPRRPKVQSTGEKQ